MIPRQLTSVIKEDIKTYSVIGILGPRQSGKTTLARNMFPEMKYTNLEDIEQREYAESDPKSFLKQGENGLIIDEVQRVPQLMSEIQVIADDKQKPGMFVITGSQNLMLMEQISQSLAGRISLFTLLPLSIRELHLHGCEIPGLHELLFKGLYPGLYSREYEISRFYKNYIKTYIERDVRQLKNISNLKQFRDLIRLCAGRTGQIVNYSSLADDIGINYNTVKSWISILETSYIISLLPPYHKNFNKQIIKMPKIYFNDTGLLCSLLGIESSAQIFHHYLKGGIFENFVLMEFRKHILNQGKNSPLYFWRDSRGREIDLLIDTPVSKKIIEIKSGETISGSFFKNLRYFQDLDTDSSPENSFVLYGGDETQDRSAAKVRGWKSLTDISAF